MYFTDIVTTLTSFTQTTEKKKPQTKDQEEDEPLVTPKRPVTSTKAPRTIRSPTPRSPSPIVTSPPVPSVKPQNDLTRLYTLLKDEAEFYDKSWKELWKGQRLNEHELQALLKKLDNKCAARRKTKVKDWAHAIVVAGGTCPSVRSSIN